MKKYYVFYECLYPGEVTWGKLCKVQLANSPDEAIGFTLDDLEAKYWEYDWLRNPGYPIERELHGDLYSAEDRDCLSVAMFTGFKAEEIKSL